MEIPSPNIGVWEEQGVDLGYGTEEKRRKGMKKEEGTSKVEKEPLKTLFSSSIGAGGGRGGGEKRD